MTDIPLQKFIKVYRKDDVVFAENSAGKEMFIVYSGKVNLYKEKNEDKVLLATVQSGDFFGEMSLVDNSPRSATAIAAEDSQLIVVDESKFLYLTYHQPHFALTVMQRLCEMLRLTTERKTVSD
jgi:CRP-like cAMP-binding protein